MTDIENGVKNEYNNVQQELYQLQEEITNIRLRMIRLEDAYHDKMEALRTIYMDARRREIAIISLTKKNGKNERNGDE